MNIEFKLDSEVFRKDNFAICRVYPTGDINELDVSTYGNITIKGNMNKLQDGITYECSVGNSTTNKFGTTYDVIAVRPKGIGNIETDDEMLIFVKAMIGSGIYNKLKKVKDICNTIKEGNFEKLVSIKGIGKKSAERIISIWEREGANSKYITELLSLGFTDDNIDELGKIYNDLAIVCAVSKTNPYEFILKGSKIRLSIIDKIALEELQFDRKDIRRIKAYIYNTVRNMSNMDFRSYMSLDELYDNKIINSIVLNAGKELYDNAIDELISDLLLKQIDNNIGLHSLYSKEIGLINKIVKFANVQVKDIKFDIEKEIDIEEDEIGFKFTEKQRFAIKQCILNNFTLIRGYAGTGKTTITRATLNILERTSEHPNFVIRQCCLSGKAAQVLNKATGRDSSTIHRLIGKVDEKKRRVGFCADVLVIDELSMVDISLFKDLLDCINNSDCRIICMGDGRQLPSLSYGKLMDDLQLFNNVNTLELTEVHRQALKSGIITTASEIRNDNIFIKQEGEIVLGELEDMFIDTEVDSLNKSIDKAVSLFDKEDVEKVQVVCATASVCYRVNKSVQSKVVDTEGKFITVVAKGNIPKNQDNTPAKYRIFENDKIIIIKNMYDVSTKEEYLDCLNGGMPEEKESEDQLNLYNGNIGKLKEIHKEYVIVEIFGKEYAIDEDGFENIQLAYAATCHKLQGSGCDEIIVCLSGDYSESFLMSNEWLYTAITRARKNCYLYGNRKNINKGVLTRHINKKNTFMELINVNTFK